LNYAAAKYFVNYFMMLCYKYNVAGPDPQWRIQNFGMEGVWRKGKIFTET